MSLEILAVEELGAGITFQDLGRRDWRRFGVPPGGVMDDHAAQWANRLLGNPPDAAVIEVLLHGAVLRALRDVTIAVTG
jgi:allophanate hydrolase subunit 2